MIAGTLRAPRLAAGPWRAVLHPTRPCALEETFEYGDWYVYVSAPDGDRPYWYATVMHGLTLHADARALLRDLAGVDPAAPGRFLALLDQKLQAAPATTPAWVNRAIREMTTQQAAQAGGEFWHHQTAADTYGPLLQTAQDVDEVAVLGALTALGPAGEQVAAALRALPHTELESGEGLPALLLTLMDATDDGTDLANDVHAEYRQWLGLASDHLGTIATPSFRSVRQQLRRAQAQLQATHTLAEAIDQYRRAPPARTRTRP